MLRLTVLATAILTATLLGAPEQAHAFKTSAIATEAEKHPDGTPGDQCIIFVDNVLHVVSNWRINLSAYTHGYQGTFKANGAKLISNRANAGRGDIIQVTPPGTSDSWGSNQEFAMPLHTAIIRKNLGGGTFKVIDSNWRKGERVLRHTFNPYTWVNNDGGIVKIWRFGSKANHRPLGSFDAVGSPEPGAIRIYGWSFDPDAKKRAVTIHAYVGGKAGSGAEGHSLGKADLERADVGRQFRDAGSAHGFRFTFGTKQYGTPPVCVYAINIGQGSNKLLGCKTVKVVDPRPKGSLDLARSPEPGMARVGGWSFDPSAKTRPNSVHVYVGSEGHNLGRAEGYRPDVPRYHEGVGDYHGFDEVFATKGTGSQKVCAYGINVGRGGNRRLGCKTVKIAAPSPRGHLDAVDSPKPGRVTVRGWTFDPNARKTPLNFHVYVGGRAGEPDAEGHGNELGRASASRPDVARVHDGVGDRHGIAKTLPTKKTGNQPVCVYAIDLGPGHNRLLNCRSVEILPDEAAPSTRIRKAPPRHLRTKRRHARVAFAFASSESYLTFACKLNRGSWRPCPNVLRFKVPASRRGRTYRLKVAAIDYSGNPDRSPAVHWWRVVRQ